LLAEHREIKRLPNCIAKGKFNIHGQLEKFTLGTGHVKFFYDKLLYLKNRYEKIYAECKRRKFNVAYYGSAWNNVPENLMNDWEPTSLAIKLITQRIKEKT